MIDGLKEPNFDETDIDVLDCVLIIDVELVVDSAAIDGEDDVVKPC